jgi:uncharacterized protein DUF2188
MARDWIHTVYKDGRWVNEVEEGEELSSHDTKEEAQSAGRSAAQQRQTEHLIHNQDGTISERNSYGNDPRDVPG